MPRDWMIGWAALPELLSRDDERKPVSLKQYPARRSAEQEEADRAMDKFNGAASQSVGHTIDAESPAEVVAHPVGSHAGEAAPPSPQPAPSDEGWIQCSDDMPDLPVGSYELKRKDDGRVWAPSDPKYTLRYNIDTPACRANHFYRLRATPKTADREPTEIAPEVGKVYLCENVKFGGEWFALLTADGWGCGFNTAKRAADGESDGYALSRDFYRPIREATTKELGTPNGEPLKGATNV